MIAGITAGVSVNGEDRSCRPGEVGVLKITSVLNGVFEPQHHKVISPADRDLVSSPVTGGTVLVSRANGNVAFVGMSAYVPTTMPHLFLPDLLWALRPKRDTNPVWLSDLINSPSFRPSLVAIAVGSSTLKKINQKAFSALPIAIPPRSEQDAIVAALQTWDEGTATADRLATLAAHRLEGWTSKRLNAFIPETSGEDTSLPLASFADLFTERDERGSKDDLLLAITGEGGVVLRSSLDRRDTSPADKSAYRLILPGDIGYNTMRMWQGVGGVSRLRGVVSPAYTVVTPRADCLDPGFVEVLFKAPNMISWFRRYSQGIVDDTLNLKFKQFRRIRMRLPDIHTQRRVAAPLLAVREETTTLRSIADGLRDQKRALMSRLLSGSLRIPPSLLPAEAVPEMADA